MIGESWQRYEPATGRGATVILDPAHVCKLMMRARNPLIIVGNEAGIPEESDPETPLDIIIRILGKKDMPLIATSTAIKALHRRGYDRAISASALEIGNLLCDPSWKLSGKDDPHDYVFILGIPIVMSTLIESGIKSFGPSSLKVISIDRTYHPHCLFSFPNLSYKDWMDKLRFIAEGVD